MHVNLEAVSQKISACLTVSSGPSSRRGSMKRVSYVIPFLAGLCVLCEPLRADSPQVIELWPGKSPDEPGGIGAEYVRMSPKLDRKQVEVTESTRMITNVTRPTISVYRPPEGKNTGTAILICPGGGYWN